MATMNYLPNAHAAAARSICPRRQVGATVIGYDSEEGTAVAVSECNHHESGGLCGGAVCLRDELGLARNERPEIGCKHAEAAAIEQTRRLGLEPVSITVTHSPCRSCAEAISDAGIRLVHVHREGRMPTDGDAVLSDSGIQINEL